jgi:Gpi18-like mannosyltransferase
MEDARRTPWFDPTAVRFPLLLFVTTRVALLGSSYMSMLLVPEIYRHEESRHMSLRAFPALDGLCRWDCGWFERIMNTGFDTAETTKVFPLLPLLASLLSKLTGIDPLISLIVVANLASLGSYIVIHAIFKQLEGGTAARWGLMFFAAYPFAFFQGAAYAESLMVLGSAGAIWLAMRGKHVWAGTVLGLGIMARHITIFAGAGLLAAQLRQRGVRPARFLLSPAIFGLVIPFMFLAAWSWYLGRKLGDPLAFWNARQMNFGPMVFWSVRQVYQNVPYSFRPELYFYIVLSVIPFAGTLALLTRRRWIELAAAAAVLMAVVYGSGGVALGRYSAACWPAFLPWGVVMSRRPTVGAAVLGPLFFLQGMFFFLFAHQWPIL